jgi:MFS family permease
MVLATERPRPARIRAWPQAWKLAVATVCFGAFMGQLDASIVTLTYRPVEQSFGVGPAAVQWVSLSYLIALVALLAPVGRRSDQKGRKLSYLHGFLIFSAGSALCGLAPDLGLLIGARVVQGVGAAFLQANSVALVTNSAPSHRMRSALGIQAAAQALGLALVPTVGGVIVSTLGWRWVFAINVPIGIVAVIAGVFFLPRTTARAEPGPSNVGGSLLIGGCATAFLLALSSMSGLHVPSWVPVLLTGAALACGRALVRSDRTSTKPLLRPLLSVRGTPGGLLAAMCGYVVLFGPLVLVPSVLEAQGLSSWEAGLTLTALPAGFAVAATVAGALLPRHWGDRRRAAAGASLSALSLAAALFLPLSPGWIVLALAGIGLGLGAFAPANNASIMRSVPARDSATAGGVINMTRGLGTAVGISLVTLTLHLAGARLSVGALLAVALLGLIGVGASAP